MKREQFTEIKYKGKNAFELSEEMIRGQHKRDPNHITVFSCKKHAELCILVWCEHHQVYEHAVEGFV